ncbi:MAG: Rieske 2Fe-2S domain-containing protein [Moorea sp. SIO2B7]|nr:Rieske 2Fe-2S domain-containing protein [Moorena sp. SIO2B7]
MTITSNQPKIEQTTDTLPSPEVEQQFNWKNCWYPVTFLQDLPKDIPYSFSLYDQPLVIFRNQDGKLVCLSDRCPHRAAKLSDGQVINGKIECLYHGWQFGNDGECLHIPQLAEELKIPNNACVQSFYVVIKQGIIWFWRGKREEADENLIPILTDLEKPGFLKADFMLDLPYEQSYLIENVMDPAHVSISHHNTRGGGNRKNAQPLEMEVIKTSPLGICGKWRGQNKPNDSWKFIDFIAPSLVLNTAYIQSKNWSFGLALYSLPMGKNHCRLLARGYRNFLNWDVKIRPRWLDHLNTNKILEQDLLLIVGQQQQIEQLAQNLQETYLPIKTSDTLVVEYRKWLDKYGVSLPFYQGYKTSHNIEKYSINIGTRLTRHTEICSSCSQAYQKTIQLKQLFIAIAIALAAFAIITDSFKIQIGAVLVAILSVILAFLASKVKNKFERSYTRH